MTAPSQARGHARREAEECYVWVLRAFGRHHNGDCIRVPRNRAKWLIDRGFVESATARTRRAAKPVTPKLEATTEAASKDGRTDAPPTGEEIAP